jgi:glycosyltransferase involved in cell wall biosynthesis
LLGKFSEEGCGQEEMKINKVLSIVVPVYNEEKNIKPLYDEIIQSIDGKYKGFEIIFIDDGSQDGSWDELRKFAKLDSRVKVINFRKNFGQSPAIAAGFDFCSGDYVITLDADLQNDPADINIIVQKLMDGYDIVNGWRKNRKDNLFSKKIPSFFGNKLVSFITKVKLKDYGCAIRGFKNDVVKNLKLYGEMHRYLPAIASKMGVRTIEIPVNHRARKHGLSKYGIGRTFRVIFDLITIKYLLSYSHKPLQIFGAIGFGFMSFGFACGMILTYQKFALQQAISGRPLLFLTVLLISLGFQVVTLGIIAEMLARIYHEGLGKASYSIRETRGFDNENINDRT